MNLKMWNHILLIERETQKSSLYSNNYTKEVTTVTVIMTSLQNKPQVQKKSEKQNLNANLKKMLLNSSSEFLKRE